MVFGKELLQKPELELPIFYSDNSCADEICNRITEYHNLLKKYGVEETKLECILQYRNHLKLMFEEYDLGHLSNAYKEFDMALPFLFRDAPVIKSMISADSLFRARVNKSDVDYKDDEMFHIKYSNRGKVGTQRFSFPGLPCLYLGASAYVCWLELNRTAFDQFQVALIKQNAVANKRKCILDLSIHPRTFYNELEKREKGEKTEHEVLNLDDYLQYWPIIAACSIAVKNEKDTFKPEYIFPQFLLQSIIEGKTEELKGIDGIKYISIKAGQISMKHYELDYSTYTNFVFPIRSKIPTDDGFCAELSNYFYIANNYSGKELQVLSDLVRKSGVEFEVFDADESRQATTTLIYGSNDKGYFYKDSIFGRIENILQGINYVDGKMELI